ncbi:hypothetical protein PMAYCL1PPCAC_30484 [Pristionchus mayeri]|uniref:Uncharacterized protein n=1 Tax=Pristionchus mayeri TaxID=1317129 RepID=A0AAN5DBY4_9BILA|nr:hypothetical protein PMAYCL1PPCAC_30484 [Pristionchus mayeri]
MISRHVLILLLLLLVITLISQAQTYDEMAPSGYEYAIKKRFRAEPVRFGKRAPREPVRFGKRSSGASQLYPSERLTNPLEY